MQAFPSNIFIANLNRLLDFIEADAMDLNEYLEDSSYRVIVFIKVEGKVKVV